MEGLEGELKATRLLLENPVGNRHEATVNPSWNKKPRRALSSVLNVFKATFRPELPYELSSDLEDATYEILMCQQNNERAFKLVWNLYVVAQQWTGAPSSVDIIGNIQDSVAQALDSVLHAFHVHPFAISPEGDSRVNLPTFMILNRDHEIATRHEKLARRIGKAWVDDRARRYNAQIRDIRSLQTSLFELLWSGTVEQLKRNSAYSYDDPERPKFERAVEELEMTLKGAIVRSRKQRFTIAICGMVKAGKSLFLNALMGREILPSDGGPHDPITPHIILTVIADLPSIVLPCRLRHVEGQTVPELQFQAEPFLNGLKELQAHQFGREMQNMFGALSDAPSGPEDEDLHMRTVRHHWIHLDDATRIKLLKFETPGFRLPRMATGERDVKILVSFMSRWTAQFQLNSIFS